jgi:hypothetical protein
MDARAGRSPAARRRGGKVPLGRIGIAIAPSAARRVYAIVDAKELGGLWRSDDRRDLAAGRDRRTRWGRGSDFAEVRVDPKDPDTVYVANVAAWKSTDGGKTFTACAARPAATTTTALDQSERPRRSCSRGDQGAIVTSTAARRGAPGTTSRPRSSTTSRPTTRFPYRVCGGSRRAARRACEPRRRRADHVPRVAPVGVEEYGYVAPDPLDPTSSTAAS